MFRLESKKHVVSHVVSHNAFRIISYSDDDLDSKFYTGIVTVMMAMAMAMMAMAMAMMMMSMVMMELFCLLPFWLKCCSVPIVLVLPVLHLRVPCQIVLYNLFLPTV